MRICLPLLVNSKLYTTGERHCSAEGVAQTRHSRDVPAREIPVKAARVAEGVVQTRHARDVPAREISVEVARACEGQR